MTRYRQLRVGAAALATAVLFLVGCSAPSPTPSEESPQPAANATSDPKSPSPSPSLLSAMPPEVPFDFDATVLPESWVLQWVDGFAGLPQFTVVPMSESASEGSRLYRDELTQCEILLFAGPDSTPLASSDDDRTLSDAQLNSFLGWGEDAITEFAFDHTIPQPGQNGSIAARVITGKYEGSSTATAARVIKSQGQAAYVYVNCPGEDATPEFEMLMGTGLLALTAAPPSS